MTMKLEIYAYLNGELQTFAGTNSEMDVLVCDEFIQGSRMKVHLANYCADGNVSVAVLKKMSLSGDWYLPWHSKEIAVWAEGARLAGCKLLWDSFKTTALSVDINLHGIQVLRTFSFCCEDTIFLAQPWDCGVPFSQEMLDLLDPKQTAIYEILDAFSHYSYQFSNHRSVYVDFQGFKTVAGYSIFDSLTHLSDLEYSPFGWPMLGSLGVHGIDDFINTHTCNEICQKLGLNSLPLLSPTRRKPPLTLDLLPPKLLPNTSSSIFLSSWLSSYW
ncbi:kinase-like domain-containing protein [Mycena sp. CBHHK59/15]|nr:kinase-like domain-containing protein [Mycena sp. CBHHK59/15]